MRQEGRRHPPQPEAQLVQPEVQLVQPEPLERQLEPPGAQLGLRELLALQLVPREQLLVPREQQPEHPLEEHPPQ